ncbi:hypothetical protein [Oceanobacillus kimchii]|uniref:Uncharacterized protein n=1 Tax=Oceanobacillus kimchii TaxID=746691 RepID=A0ABQ5TKI3_9BACI|nr:hypothetical protein [Oceanobacillus kimchii]GLO66133.1 hypothetical protein MACH08_19170 [Oceanobacillus kimchii]
MEQMVIHDTAEVVIKRKSDGHKVASAETQLASLTGSLGIDEKIYAGIGNKPIYRMRGQKELTTSFTNATFNLEFLSMSQGVDIVNKEVTVYKKEDGLQVASDETGLTVTIKGQPIGGKVDIRKVDGTLVELEAQSGAVNLPEGDFAQGDSVSAIYRTKIVGNVVEIEASKFSEAFEIEYYTIGYDLQTQQVYKDIRIQLDHAIPGGDFELSFEAGSAISPEITFEAMVAPNSDKIGRVIVSDHNASLTP